MPSRLDPSRRPIYSSPLTGQAWTSEDEAAAWLDDELERLRHPPPPPQPGDEPLGAYCWRWWQAGAAFWPTRTAAAYRRSLALILGADDLAVVPLARVTHERVRAALAALLGATWQRARKDGTPTGDPKPYARRTIQHARTALGLALSDLVPDVLPHNPVTRVRLPKVQAPEQPVWDGDQADRFLEAAERLVPHLALAYRLILRRALRRGEVLALRWADVDERRGVLVVDETIGRRAGEAGDTKGRRRREIPLSADLLERLRARKGAQSRPCPWVFTNPETAKPWHGGVLSDWIPKVCEAAGLPVCQPKDMRATCATGWLNDGVPLPVVSRMLGHASIATTSAHYERVLKHREERLARLADQLDAALDRSAEAARAEAPQPIRRVSGVENGS